eukprot:TRINITY_DN3189_c0_g1_i1.p1 TRINITY_DN3189_c0_g1~~TRINITY_DN3189_c0_g1_i1.p1  ORF type:complete len:331 (+),score=148.77 TRINITY_DN3189_c0_g1_i1:132-1124(+)
MHEAGAASCPPPAEGFTLEGYNAQLMLVGGASSGVNTVLVHTVFTWVCKADMGLISSQTMTSYLNHLYSGPRDTLEQSLLKNTPFALKKSVYVSSFNLITPPDHSSSNLSSLQLRLATQILSSCCSTFPKNVTTAKSESLLLSASADVAIAFVRRHRRAPTFTAPPPSGRASIAALSSSLSSVSSAPSNNMTLSPLPFALPSAAVPDFGIAGEYSSLPYIFSLVVAQRGLREQFNSELSRLVRGVGGTPSEQLAPRNSRFQRAVMLLSPAEYFNSESEREYTDVFARAGKEQFGAENTESLFQKALTLVAATPEGAKQNRVCEAGGCSVM